MRQQPTTVALSLALASSSLVHAQNREGAMQEAAREGVVEACAGQPECVAAMRDAQTRQSTADARWEAKPLDQKLEPYLWIAVALGTIWYLARRRRK